MNQPPFSVFADESGTSAGDDCYGIGALVVAAENLPRFEAWVARAMTKHKVSSEIKWKDISTSYAPMNLAIDLLAGLLKSSGRFSAIMVHKPSYRKWALDAEKAFYTTYTLLLVNRAKVKKGEYRVAIDGRDDRYGKNDEVVATVSNSMLRKIAARSQVVDVCKHDSKVTLGIQVADILTGALTAAHNLWLKPDRQISPGKLLLISKLAGVLGWPDLCCDTYPDAPFNIWHFPPEFWRRCPETRLVPASSGKIAYVTKTDVDGASHAHQKISV